MRERKSFAERTKVLSSDEARKKYFLVYEGKVTESLYFEAVNELREKIKLNPLIELIPIVRSYSEEGWSNPKKIVERMIQNIEESTSGNISYETLLNWMMDYFQENGSIENNRPLAKSLWETLTHICQEKLSVSLDMTVEKLQEVCENIINFLTQAGDWGKLTKDVTKIINNRNVTYEKNLDKICFIVDRDRKSFTKQQYAYVLEQCQKEGFGLYLTNPCFEFWLLMHFDDVTELDQEQIFENPMVTSRRRYLEQELRKRMPKYKKANYSAKTLVENIDTAINNETKFCEDLEEMEYTIGSNIGLLIREMRDR